MNISDFVDNKGALIFYMITEGTARLSSLYDAMERAGADPEALKSLEAPHGALWELHDKHYYRPENAIWTSAGPLGEDLVGLDEGSAAEAAVYKTCRGIYDLMCQLEKKVSAMLAEGYRRDGIPPPSDRTWIENETLQWVESRQPSLIGERLAGERGEPVK